MEGFYRIGEEGLARDWDDVPRMKKWARAMSVVLLQRSERVPGIRSRAFV